MTLERTEWTPETLNIDGVDLTDVATTKYVTPIIDFSSFVDMFLYFKAVQTGAVTAGAVKLTVELFADDGTTILLTLDLVTAIPTSTASDEEQLVFGGESAVVLKGLGTLSTDANILRVIHKARFTIEIVTASDAATSSLGTMYILASR